MKKRVVCLLLSVVLIMTQGTIVMATRSKTEVQREKAAAEQQLEEAQDKINSLSQQQAAIASQIDDTNADLFDKLVQIDVAEQEIAATEASIVETQGQIDVTTQNLMIAEAERDEQYANMKTRIRYIYENGGDSAWFKLILEVSDIATMLNRAEYAQSMHDYDRKMLAEFAAIVQQVSELKASLEAQKAQLEEDKLYLENVKAALKEQEAQLQATLAQLQATSSNYASQISQTRAQAEQISALIAQQQAEIERIEEAEREAARRAAEEAARRAAEEERRRQQAQNNNNNSGGGSGGNKGAQTVPTYNGNKTGESIVAYADQFVGNPYVWGGNSLTNGIDCSHFVYQVLKNCGVYSGGYVTSAGWRHKGSPVGSLAEAQAGDVICYNGHVAIYDGHGGIVEAKGSKWGITHDRSATYGTILAIRRFI